MRTYFSVNNNSEIFSNTSTMVDRVGRSSPSQYYFNQFSGIMSSGQMSPSDTLDSGTCSDLDGTPPPPSKKINGNGISVTLIGMYHFALELFLQDSKIGRPAGLFYFQPFYEYLLEIYVFRTIDR